MSEPITVIVLGAGNRGRVYASYAERHPEDVRVVAVAEPKDAYRNALADRHGLSRENTFVAWEDVAKKPKFADAVVIATPDAEHVGPVLAFAEKGYALLLEKPMAPTAEECVAIVAAVKRHQVLFAVGHVLRYTPYTQTLKRLLAEGAVGEVMSLQHLEPVGYWHQAHSYVRGNWRNAGVSSPMLLAKSCHDLDWIRYVMDKRCVSVSSFGALSHFKRANKPPEAEDAKRCLECAYEPDCPYSAKRIYLGMVEQGEKGMPLTALTLDTSKEGVTEALRVGPYGRCVYECDNDVVDHQVVNMMFEDQRTASFTMTGFTKLRHRQTGIFGTRGEIRGDGLTLTVYDFLTRTLRTVSSVEGLSDADSTLEGHGGGDEGLMAAFVRAVSEKDGSYLLSGPDETLESHLTVFAAERSRLEGRTVNL